VSSTRRGKNGGGARKGSGSRLRRKRVKADRAKKRKPIREESFPAELIFQANDFSYIDSVVDPDRAHRAGPKGYPPSAMFMALLLMYLKEIRSVLDLVRFLNANPEWLRRLGLRRRIGGIETYSVPDRTRFYRFARRTGVEGMMEVLSVMVVRLMQKGVIKGTSVSLDATMISAWFKDCRVRKDERHLKVCRHEKSKDRDASWGYDHHRDRYVYGYKVHVLLDSQTALPLTLTVTAAGYGESRTMAWFVTTMLKLGIHVKKFFADMGYDTNEARLLITQTLKAIPFIPLQTRGSKGATGQEKRSRRKLLAYRFYAKNFIKRFWVDPDSKRFDREYDVRTLSEQAFSVGKGSLNLDSLMHRGREWATLQSVAICIVMLAVAKTAVDQGRPDLIRCSRNFAA
jgi:transposase